MSHPDKVKSPHFAKLKPLDRPLLHEREILHVEKLKASNAPLWMGQDEWTKPDSDILDWWLSGNGVLAPWDLYHHEVSRRFQEGSIELGGAIQFQKNHRVAAKLGYASHKNPFDIYPSMMDVTKRDTADNQPGYLTLSYSQTVPRAESIYDPDAYYNEWGIYASLGGTSSFVMPETTIVPFPMWNTISLGGFYKVGEPGTNILLNAELVSAQAMPYHYDDYNDTLRDVRHDYYDKMQNPEPKPFGTYTLKEYDYDHSAQYIQGGAALDLGSDNIRFIPAATIRWLVGGDDGNPLATAPMWLAGSAHLMFQVPAIKFPNTFTLEGMASSSFFNGDGEGYGNTFRGDTAVRSWLEPWKDIVITGALTLAWEKPWGDALKVEDTQTDTQKFIYPQIKPSLKEHILVEPFYRYGGWGVDARSSLQYRWLEGLYGTLDIGAVGGYQYAPENGGHGIFLGFGAGFNLGYVDSDMYK